MKRAPMLRVIVTGLLLASVSTPEVRPPGAPTARNNVACGATIGRG
jgi:hypothetical protein